MAIPNLIAVVVRELQREDSTIDALALKLDEPRARISKSIQNLQRQGRVEHAGMSANNRAIYRMATKPKSTPRPDFAAAWLFNPPLA